VSRVEVFLDETPGETRGVILRDGRAEHLIIQRGDDLAEHRLGARSVGRVMRIEPAIKAAFVDLGAGGAAGFLALSGAARLAEGAKVEVEVTAEARDGKGPALKLISPASGEPRLIAEGPDVSAILSALAPGTAPITGAAAIQASWDAEDEALASIAVVEDLGLDLKVERTRALVAVDLDWMAGAGPGGRPARDRANARGLVETARLIGLKSWGGLVAVDLIGVGHDGDAISAAAKRAFAGLPQRVLGPVNRFGVLMLSLPWGRTPIEARLKDESGADSLRTRAQAAVRTLNHGLMSDRAVPVITLRSPPDEAALAEPWVRRLGPRARLVADPARRPGESVLEQG